MSSFWSGGLKIKVCVVSGQGDFRRRGWAVPIMQCLSHLFVQRHQTRNLNSKGSSAQAPENNKQQKIKKNNKERKMGNTLRVASARKRPARNCSSSTLERNFSIGRMWAALHGGRAPAAGESSAANAREGRVSVKRGATGPQPLMIAPPPTTVSQKSPNRDDSALPEKKTMEESAFEKKNPGLNPQK